MGKVASVRSFWLRTALAVLLIGVLCPAWAQKVKDPKHNLDNLTFSRPQLRLSETLTEAETLTSRLENVSDMDRFRSEYGTAWHFLMDERTGRVNVVSGGAIPFIPGPANDLRWESYAEASCQSPWCLPLSKIEGLARDFLAEHQSIFKVPLDQLVLDPVGSVPIGDSIYLLRFQWVYGGVPVDGGSVFFIINNGNLIQVGFAKFGDIKLDSTPTISVDTAWENLAGYIGGIAEGDEIVNPGELAIMPITPRGMDAEMFSAPFGTMIDYVLVYKIAFHRPEVMGTWEALVNAHTGEILTFRDANEYGHVQGGVFKTDAPQTEVTSPFPYVNYGASAWCDVAGNFTGTSGTSTMNGRTGSSGNVGGVYITDTCGSISLAANGSGLIDFGTSSGTDCTTPGSGGAGNTHASRTQYWNVTQIKMKAYSYLPTNTWLQGHLQDKVNLNQTCNAYWDGTKLNFFHKGSGSCHNTGELPGVSLHEWGHGMDANDGSGGTSPPLESRADWTALLQTHQSCAGGGFLSSNCSGYGDACTSCTGVRDADYAKHTHPTAWTPQNNAQSNPGYSCSAGSYNGPCGWEDHCESGIASQALWDFANRDLEAAPTSMDNTSAWILADRLYYTGMPTMGSMYTCSGSPKVSNGCGTGMLYLVMKAIDDDGDGVANGTPHAAAIFAALNRHGIGCGASGDATNQNETSCPTLTTPTLSGAAGDSQDVVNWTTGGANATRYFVFRNETSCTAGFTKIATVTAPTLTYTDTACYNGVTYYYRVQAATAKDQCTSVMSNCTTLTPVACTPPGAPVINSITDVSACAASGIQVNYTAGSGATSHNLLKDAVSVVTGYVSGATYTPGDTSSHTYIVQAVSGSCTTNSTGVSGTDANGTPGAPVINSITDVSACAASGIKVNYTAGSGATSHNLLKDGTSVVTGYVSGATYTPGDTSSHTYVIRAVNGTCTTDSTGVAGTDANGTPAAPAAPTFASVAQTTLTVNWTAVSGATSYDVWRVAGATCTGVVKITSSPVAGTTYPDSGLTCNTPYSYLITANNGACTSANGACASQTTAACAAPPRVPYSVTPDKVSTANHGTDGSIQWDVTNCVSTNYHIIYGKGENLAAWTVDGGKCAIGTTGTYSWTGIPDPSTYASRFLWFLVVGDNGSTTEGSWGMTTAGAEEGGSNASNQCSCSTKNTAGSCGTP